MYHCGGAAVSWGKTTGAWQQREVYTVQCIGEVPSREVSLRIFNYCNLGVIIPENNHYSKAKLGSNGPVIRFD